jgi:hypothetical protein
MKQVVGSLNHLTIKLVLLHRFHKLGPVEPLWCYKSNKSFHADQPSFSVLSIFMFSLCAEEILIIFIT